MSEEQEVVLSKQDRLALALVAGKTIRDWVQENGVPERTAYRWASEPEVRRQIQDWRRAAIDNTLRFMAERSAAALDRIEELGKVADSDAVRLKANRALVTDQIALARHSNLEHRLSLIEEDRSAKPRNANRPAV